MPLPGGEADKLGNRYEGRWTVYCMIDVMDEKADYIELEKPGEDAFEFFLKRNGQLECHQVKRQIAGRGQWTVSSLENNQNHVLSNFWTTLQNQSANCVFVSTQGSELGELIKRVKDSQSWEDFETNYLNQSLTEVFNKLCGKWTNCSQFVGYEALKRVIIRNTGDEEQLVETIDNRLTVLVEGDPQIIRLELEELILDKLHCQLTAHNIWHHLEQRGYRRREWSKDPHILAAIEKNNQLYLSRFDNEKIAGEFIERNEANIAIDKLTYLTDKKGLLLTGEAGLGKSGVLGQVLTTLKTQRIPLIVFRIDRLEPTLFPHQLGEQLGLPDSPANVLAAIAQGRECVLIIDQIDAVSQASGRNPSFFECVEQIIKQAQVHENIRLLLACRKFDLDNDSRFRDLIKPNGILENLEIRRLSHIQVKEVCSRLELDETKLTPVQLNLLSIPLHLKLLEEVVGNLDVNTFNLSTVQELYDVFWDRKQAQIKDYLGRPFQWTKVIDALCQYMSKNQTISAPQEIVDDWADDAKVMASNHVLVREDKRFSFFHESFFDYAFARRFSANDQKLSDYLFGREQHLFYRTQVRQILFYRRQQNFNLYLDDLNDLLTHGDIRFHIKKLVFALLTDLHDPTEEEWEILKNLINHQSRSISHQIWQLLSISSHWFKLIDNLGILDYWLNSENNELIDKTINILFGIQRRFGEHSDRIAELLEPYLGLSDEWRRRFLSLIVWCDLDQGRRFFELFLKLIDDGTLDDARGPIAVNSEFWDLIYSLPEKQPQWSCEVIGHYLNRRLQLSIAQGQVNPFDWNNPTIPDGQFDEQILLSSAKNASLEFVNNVLSFMLQIMELNIDKTWPTPWKDFVWRDRTYGTGYQMKSVILTAMSAALSIIASQQPKTLIKIENQFKLKESKFETIEYLLICAYTANGDFFANVAIDYLCEKSSRFQKGYSISAGNSRAAKYWATKELLEAVTPHCSDFHLQKLEEKLLNYYPEWEKNYTYRHSRGYAQLILLSSITVTRRSKKVISRLQELERKFVDLQWIEAPGKIDPPKNLEAWIIDSPIPERATEKMTDEQWLKAISQYDYTDGGSNFEKRGELTGGAWQLSSNLQKEVSKNPLRFAKLIQQFPHDVNECYFNAVLQGISESEIKLDVETVSQVLQFCHQLPHKPCGKYISWLFQKLTDFEWENSTLDILLNYALNDPDPEQKNRQDKTNTDNSSHQEDILFLGINSVRGSAVRAIALLIFANKEKADYFRKFLPQIVTDPSIAVRACTAEMLTALLNYDRDLAVNFFLNLCKTEDIVLGVPTVERFLYYALNTHYSKLSSILERMIRSDQSIVIRVGSRQSCLASLNIEEANTLVNECLNGTVDHRIAAAEIFRGNLHSAYFRQSCENNLIPLFSDPDKQVREEAARCFSQFEGNELAQYTNLIEQFVNSPAFSTSCYSLIHALEKTTAKLPEATCLVCEKFVESFGIESGDIRTSTAGDSNTISKLLIRVYSQNSRNSELQSRCLDVVDRMIEMGSYGLDKALLDYAIVSLV
jgi:hypothetical protein